MIDEYIENLTQTTAYGAPITVPVTACATTSVTRAPCESRQYTILQLHLLVLLLLDSAQ